MSLTGILLGLINIAIVVAILILVGLLVWWGITLLCQALGVGGPPEQVKKIFMVIVALIAIAMIIGLLLGVPPYWKIVRHEGPPIGAYIPPVPDIATSESKNWLEMYLLARRISVLP